ncbi:hypothetical protein CMO93_04220 [Candidatus Woesearchaeota archaeon]|nr:hypothetical protein [Candidatus Woesearchaeota archaeon]|tara:strand:+ start:1511 stop:2089 length:579 start_codon:yes stop_codon:yes gene_type:complete
MNFQKEKNQFLRKKDKSIKGKIDNKIKRLVNKINSLDDFFTTSSCSGRIVLLIPNKTKHNTKWLFSSHDKVDFKKIENQKILDKLPKNDVRFLMEPAILHIACKNIEAAKKLLNIARDIGFRRSGIISIGKNRIVLELISTERIDTIISKNGKLLIDENYFEVLVNEGNKKLEKTWGKINKLYKAIDKIENQ